MEYDIYELMRGLQDDSVPLPEDGAADLRRIKELTMKKIEKDADRDYWMTAPEAKKYGLIDEVLTPRKKK